MPRGQIWTFALILKSSVQIGKGEKPPSSLRCNLWCESQLEVVIIVIIIANAN